MTRPTCSARSIDCRTPDVIAAAPYLYIVAKAGDTPLVVAGTWLDQARGLAPTWKLDGNWVASRDDETQALVGRNVARQFHLAPGSEFDLSYLGRTAHLRVAGVVDAGGADDDQTFVNLAVAQKLAGLEGKIELVQLSVGGNAASIAAFESRLASALPGYDVKPIRQVAEAQGNLLNRIHLLIVSMIVLILVLTALCVLATMAALAMERREDVGLMKALGGSISRIVSIIYGGSRGARRSRRIDRLPGGHRALELDGAARFRHFDHAAMGDTSRYVATAW